jgi:hypothetical protein
VEQILSAEVSLHLSRGFALSSFVQMRGSVPVFWTQDTSVCAYSRSFSLALAISSFHFFATVYFSSSHI